MLTRKAWPVALSVVFVGSVAVIVQGSDELPPPVTPAKPVERPAISKESQTPAQTLESSKAPSAQERKPIKPKELSDSTKKGLEYLISQQHENGGFGQGGGWRSSTEGGGRVEGNEVKDPPDVGNTCIASLALIRAGNTPKEGKYSKHLIKAAEFIEQHVEAADKESLYVTPIRDTQLQSKIGRYVDTFLAALVLTELKGQMPDKAAEDRLFAALNKTIGKIEANQQADGTFAGNAGWASVLSQGLCSKALNRASQKGVAVKAETIKRDLDQSVAQLDPSKAAATGGPVGSSAGLTGRTSLASSSARADAGVALYSLSANASRVQDTVNTNQKVKTDAEAVLKNPMADDKARDLARGQLKEVAVAEQANAQAAKQVVASLGNERFVKGFGNNGGEEFLSYMNLSETLLAQGGEAWEKWDRQVCETITKCQNEDGSWSGHHCITGRTFCTAAALLTMMADRAPLPVAETKPAAK